MDKGLFITFEGGDGSGKSTQIGLLQEYLEEQGREVLLTREPGGTAISEAVREILLDKGNTAMDPITEMLLYAAARAQLVAEVIRPAVQRGVIVICDRFLDSSIAYQGYGRELGDSVMEINRFGVGDCMPDLTVYLRVTPEIGRTRIGGRERDRIESESESFHHRVFEGYEELSRQYPDRIVSIDAGGTIEEIAAVIREKVEEKIDDVSSGK